MSTTPYFDPLTKRQQDICSYGGVLGVLLSVTCLIQLMIFGTTHWKVAMLLLIYLVPIVAFILLALQKSIAPVWLVISAALSFVAAIVWIRSGAFSLVVLLLLLYSIIAVVFLYAEQIPARLKQKKAALKAEKALWEGKI